MRRHFVKKKCDSFVFKNNYNFICYDVIKKCTIVNLLMKRSTYDHKKGKCLILYFTSIHSTFVYKHISFERKCKKNMR